MTRGAACIALALGSLSCASAAPSGFATADSAVAARRADDGPVRPAIAHHEHLVSPAVAALLADAPLPPVELPDGVGPLLRAREAAWNDSSALYALLAEDVLVLDSRGGRWVRGRGQGAVFLSRRFARPYTITPVALVLRGAHADVAANLARAGDGQARPFGQVLLSLERGEDGAWRIAAESPSFPLTPPGAPTSGADALIAQMDEAGVRRAVVLSVAYLFGSPLRAPVPDEHARVRAENDWTAAEVARFPERLVAFCGVNPLRDYAVAEVERCTRERGMRGLKLHFGNSGVDVRNPEHVQKVRAVFRAANGLRIPIVVHLWTLDRSYGGEHSRIFLEQILPEAPEVTVQVAHMADAGPGYNFDAAMAPLADAVAAGDPRTRNLWFDITTNVTATTPAATADLLVRRIRQVGPARVLFGADGGILGNVPMRQSWGALRGMLPLTDDEFRTIAGNVAPYLR